MKLTGVSEEAGGTCRDSWSDLIDTELGGQTEHHRHLLSHRGHQGTPGASGASGELIYLHMTVCLLGASTEGRTLLL